MVRSNCNCDTNAADYMHQKLLANNLYINIYDYQDRLNAQREIEETEKFKASVINIAKKESKGMNMVKIVPKTLKNIPKSCSLNIPCANI